MDKEDAQEHLLGREATPTWQTRRRQQSIWRSAFIPWTLCGMLSFVIFMQAVSVYQGRRHEKQWGSYERGFATDFGPITSEIQLVHRKFHSSFRVDENDMWYITLDPKEPLYVGTPTSELDQAWEDILKPRFFGLWPDEAQELGFSITEKDTDLGKLWIEPSGFHDLHCLNYLRQALDSEYYTDINVSRNQTRVPGTAGHRLHLDHCIELLRQSLTCHLDLTPIPRPWLTKNLLHADQDQLHTCRDFGAIKQWVVDHSAIPEEYQGYGN